MNRGTRLAAGLVLAAAAVGGGLRATASAAPPAASAPAGPLAVAAAGPPEASSIDISLDIHGVPEVGIPAYTGTYGLGYTGPSGGPGGGDGPFSDPDGIMSYVTSATHTSKTDGNPPTPTWWAKADLTKIVGPRLAPGATPLIDIPEVHDYIQCTPPHGLVHIDAVTPQVKALGHVLDGNGSAVTVDTDGAALGLPAVQSASLTFTMDTIRNFNPPYSGRIRFVITVNAVITDLNGHQVYSGPLVTYTLADVTADCQEKAPAQTDVQIAKSDSGTAEPGGTVSYTLEVKNNGPDPADNVTVQDAIPEELAGATTSTPGCAITGAPPAEALGCSFGTLGLGEKRTITITAKVRADARDQSVIGNCATVYTTTQEANTANNESCTRTTVEAPPPPPTDIEVTKMTGATEATPGGTLTYTVTVTNHGTVPAENVLLGDIPGTLATLDGTPATCTPSGAGFTCAIGTLGPGLSRSFTVTVTVSADAKDGQVVTNCAAADTTTLDDNEDNNSACAQTPVETTTLPPPAGRTDLSVAKYGSPSMPLGGNTLFFLTLTNNSDADAENVVLYDVLGEFIDAYVVSRICALDGRILSCHLGTLPAHEGRTIVVHAKATGGAAIGDSLQNCESAETATPEVTLDNDRSCESTLITGPDPVPAAVSIEKTASATVHPGGAVSYTITAANHGPATATDVIVTDILAGQIARATQVPPGCTLRNRTIACVIGTLGVGESRTYRIEGTAVADAKDGSVIENCGVIYATTPDSTTFAVCVSSTVKRRPVPGPPYVPVTG
jgi:uncharacterized repeat protein (TIGR01451 family)